jgi:hypothetical protein
VGSGNQFAIDAFALFSRPVKERGGIGDFPSGKRESKWRWERGSSWRYGILSSTSNCSIPSPDDKESLQLASTIVVRLLGLN